MLWLGRETRVEGKLEINFAGKGAECFYRAADFCLNCRGGRATLSSALSSTIHATVLQCGVKIALSCHLRVGWGARCQDCPLSQLPDLVTALSRRASLDNATLCEGTSVPGLRDAPSQREASSVPQIRNSLTAGGLPPPHLQGVLPWT